ncbi:AraC family transcriptional regulator [Poriferisphaera sp. WC338]|uniref:helix-turn-helix transcriptional regulator n=1 Tax=Poriferisphaera sp. WC338 TaxID=3425129 RepID=UPI003D816E23
MSKITSGYLPINEDTMTQSLYVTGAGSAHVPIGAKYPQGIHPHLYQFTWQKGRVLPEYQVIYIHDGYGVFESYETGQLKIQPRTLLVLFPDRWHRYRPDTKTGWSEYWISLHGEVLYRWQDQGLLSPDKPLIICSSPQKVKAECRHIIRHVCASKFEYPIEVLPHTLRLMSYVLDREGDVLKEGHRENSTAVEQLSEEGMTQQAIQFIWNHGHRQISVQDVADQFPVSRRTLERYFNVICGRSILDELIACRIGRAKRLLKCTHMSVKQIAFTTGFSSSSHLCRVFQSVCQCSPGEYRNQS